LITCNTPSKIQTKSNDSNKEEQIKAREIPFEDAVNPWPIP